MKYFLSITFLFLYLLSVIFVILSCSPLVEQGGFADAQITISSSVVSTGGDSTDTPDPVGTGDPVGPEDVDPVPEEGDPPPTRIF